MQEICARKRIDIAGLVQGVGFRPFVYRIARQFEIRGYVLNSSEGVVIEAEASETRLENFIAALKTELPPLARVERLNVRALEPLCEAIHPGQRRQLRFERGDEIFKAGLARLGFNHHAFGRIEHVSADFELARDAIDKRPETDALHQAR